MTLQLKVEWLKDAENPETENLFVQGTFVGWIAPRPQYCDRGHWAVEVQLPDIDVADKFPRYYMDYDTAKAETEAFLRWRILRVRTKSKRHGDDTG